MSGVDKCSTAFIWTSCSFSITDGCAPGKVDIQGLLTCELSKGNPNLVNRNSNAGGVDESKLFVIKSASIVLDPRSIIEKFVARVK